MTRRGGGFTSAVGLLTRWPVGGTRSAAIGVAWFPVVGAMLGIVGGSVYWLSRLALPPLLAATTAVAVIVTLTGALHEDGLADYADGLGASRGRAEALEIMRDPRVGVFGVIALVLSLIWRISALSALSPAEGLAALAMTHSMARSAAGALSGVTPAQPDGLGRLAAETTSAGEIVASIIGGLAVGALVAGVWMVPAALLATATVFGFRGSALRRLGGVTGDVLGACEQTVEIMVLTLAVVAVRITDEAAPGFL